MKMEENKSKPLTVGKSAILLNAETVRNAIDSESEVPGPMPNELWDLIRNNKTSAEQTIREVLRQTKEGIKSRLGV